MPSLVGIDVETRHASQIIAGLRKRLGTVYVENRGKYRECPECTNVMYCGELSESAMDALLYRVKYGRGVIGTYSPEGA